MVYRVEGLDGFRVYALGFRVEGLDRALARSLLGFRVRV
jgi:hypothetical protein